MNRRKELGRSKTVEQQSQKLLFVCKVVRKHFFSDRTYVLQLFENQLIMGSKLNDSSPKYQLKLSSDFIFPWILQNGKIVGFKFPYRGVLKDFHAAEADLLALKEHLGNLVLFQHFEKYYRILQHIDSGNFGSVIKCQCKLTNKVFAVKQIKADGFQNQTHQIQNEIDMLRKVNHTNVVRCLEVYRDDYDFRIVTELVEGENLKSFIDKQKAPLSQEVVMNIAEQILSGLCAIHTKHILHRDLKLSNIMYNRNQVKIIDFGLACLNGRQLKEHPNCGTTGYAAPEVLNVWKLKKGYDTKADVFSFACVIYKLLTLNGLFQGSSEHEIFVNNRDCIFTLKEQGRWFDLLRILLKKNPDERPNAHQTLEVVKTMKQFHYFDVNVWYTNVFVLKQDVDMSICLSGRGFRKQNSLVNLNSARTTRTTFTDQPQSIVKLST